MRDGFRQRPQNLREGDGGAGKLLARQVPEKRQLPILLNAQGNQLNADWLKCVAQIRSERRLVKIAHQLKLRATHAHLRGDNARNATECCVYGACRMNRHQSTKIENDRAPERAHRTVVYVSRRPVGESVMTFQYRSGRTSTPFS